MKNKPQNLKEIVSRLILIDINDPDFVLKYPFAGYILFYKDIDQSPNGWKKLKETNDYYKRQYKSIHGLEILRSIDQEGGVVYRFDYPDFPAVCSQYSINDPADAYKIAILNGLILKFLEFNVNFSPVMDVNTNNQNPIIGVRSFGEDSEKVSLLSQQYIKAYNQVNLMCTGKHFPGHGDTDKDSHLDLPYSYANQTHLFPFLQNKSHLPSIMTAHVVYKNIDTLPATISKKTIDLIQPYEGIIFSDALNMKAMQNFNWEETLIQAIRAGVDILLILGEDQLKLYSINFLAKQAEKDPLLESILIDKYHKINKFVQKFDLHTYTQEEYLQYIQDLNTWMFNQFDIPIKEKGDKQAFKQFLELSQILKIIVFSNHYLETIGVSHKIIDNIRNIQKLKSKELEVLIVKDPTNTQEIEAFVHNQKDIFLVYLVIDNSYKALIDRLRNKGKRVYIFSFSNPYLESDYVVNFYSFCSVHLKSFERWLGRL